MTGVAAILTAVVTTVVTTANVMLCATCRDGGMGGPSVALAPGDGDLVQHLVESYRLEGMQTQLPHDRTGMGE